LDILNIIISSIVGMVIGWFTNYLAIIMLFRPYEPVRIPVFNIEVQGLIPKRRDDISSSLGDIIAKELISVDDIVKNIMGDDDKNKMMAAIDNKLDGVIRKKIPSYIPGMFRDKITNYIKKAAEEEVIKFMKNDSGRVMDELNQRMNIKQIVEDKINGFDVAKLEKLVMYAAGKELKAIEIVGGVLGLVIGLAEGVLVQVI